MTQQRFFDDMRIGSIAPWFGCNRLLANEVGMALDDCRWVGIPFAGGMPELVTIKASSIVVNDLHEAVINLAMCAAHPKTGPQLYRQLRRLPFCESVLADAQRVCLEWADDPPAIPHLGWAVNYFVAVWMGRSGIAGTSDEFYGRLPKRWNANGGDSNTRYRSAVSSLVAWRRVLAQCNFVVMDCFDFLSNIKDVASNGVYCDPPFPGPGDRYRFRFSEEDHRHLAETLAGYHETIVVCRFYDHPLVRELYPETRWRWRHLVGRKQSNAAAPEVLITNTGDRIC